MIRGGRRREVGPDGAGSKRWTCKLCEVCFPGFKLCGGRTSKYCCTSSEKDICLTCDLLSLIEGRPDQWKPK